MRERDQTHSYWYIPSAPRENYSLLVMESTGMMKMATGEGSLHRQGAVTGSRFVFGGYRGLRWRNSRSMLRSGCFRSRRYIWVQEVRQGSHEGLTRQGARPRGGAPTLVTASSTSWSRVQVSWITFGEKITFPEILFRLDSV